MPFRFVILVTVGILTAAGSDSVFSQKRAPARLRADLDRAIAAASVRRDVRVESECLIGGERKAVELYGTGVGIWRGAAQFTLDDARLVAVLRAVAARDFLSMPDSFGGRSRKPPGAAQGLRLTCSVALAFPAGERTVVQLEGGEQSAALKDLAAAIFDQCEEPARAGITIASFQEGLSAVASGRLAPETLSLVAHFKPREGTGWLLEIRHARIRSQSFSGATGYGPAKRTVSSGAHIRALARSLAAVRLPPRLSLEEYTELQLEVLNQRAEVLARVFAGQPEPGVDERAQFLKVRGELDRLHQLVTRQGQADP